MKMLTVKQVAKLSGVSVRALHHYDAIGLLKPAHVGRNGYRYYGREELLRLQQVLLHRELGLPLIEIAAIIDAPGFDRLEALQAQRDRLVEEAERFALLINTIDRTIASLKGDRRMRNADLYKGVSAEKQAQYEAWLTERYGGDMAERIEMSKRSYAELSEAAKAELQDQLKDLETAWAGAMVEGIPADSPALDPVLEQFRAWVAIMWGRPCSPEALAGLADMHLAHPDFVARYEALGDGFSAYHAEAMKAYAARRAE